MHFLKSIFSAIKGYSPYYFTKLVYSHLVVRYGFLNQCCTLGQDLVRMIAKNIFPYKIIPYKIFLLYKVLFYFMFDFEKKMLRK